MRPTNTDIRNEPLIRRQKQLYSPQTGNMPDNVFITGANSFIGVHIISHILKSSDSNCYLLIRASTKNEAKQKLREAFKKWKIEDISFDRLKIFTGDLCHERMGLSTEEFTQIRIDTGQVIHLAMTPLYHFPYSHFERIWIPELKRMIDFCGDKEYPKVLHYTSSFNANFFTDDNDFAALNTNAWQSGYAGFKWVAEKAIENAVNNGLRASIYNIPLVLGSEEHGICPRHYSIWMILDMFLQSGYYFDFSFKIMPVDILASLISSNIQQGRLGKNDPYLRPALKKQVTHLMLESIAGNMLGLRYGSIKDVKAGFQNPRRFDFMVPPEFHALMNKCNFHNGKLPQWFNTEKLPDASLIFMRNLNTIISNQNN